MNHYVCIVCPNSCRLAIEEQDGQYLVSGNECKRGVAHAIGEYTAPSRMLTTTVAIEGGVLPRLPVISDGEVLKSKMDEALKTLYTLRVQAPVQCGQVVLANVCGTGVDILASRSMKQADSAE